MKIWKSEIYAAKRYQKHGAYVVTRKHYHRNLIPIIQLQPRDFDIQARHLRQIPRSSISEL